MPNTLAVYDPIFYAQEALIQLEKALGMASRVYRGYDMERQTVEKGSVISITKPSTFSAQNAPSSAQDIYAQTVNITLDQWKEVKFSLTDKELAYTSERIINDHIRPAAYALADNIDTALCALAKDIPWYFDSTAAISDITGVRKVMFDNAAPVFDAPNMHLMLDSSLEKSFLELAAFTQYNGAGDTGANAQLRGSLGTRFGFNVFANQNVQSHVKGTCDDTALQVLGATLKGATQISLDAVDAGVTGTLVKGDSFVIAGNTQRYVVTATNTAAANVFTNVQIFPPLAQDHADNDAVTVNLDNHVMNLGFHRNAFAVAMAKLPDTLPNNLGAQVATVTDEKTGLSLRSRLFYDGSNSKVFVALDVLYGVKTLDPNLAVRLRG